MSFLKRLFSKLPAADEPVQPVAVGYSYDPLSLEIASTISHTMTDYIERCEKELDEQETQRIAAAQDAVLTDTREKVLITDETRKLADHEVIRLLGERTIAQCTGCSDDQTAVYHAVSIDPDEDADTAFARVGALLAGSLLH